MGPRSGHFLLYHSWGWEDEAIVILNEWVVPEWITRAVNLLVIVRPKYEGRVVISVSAGPYWFKLTSFRTDPRLLAASSMLTVMEMPEEEKNQ